MKEERKSLFSEKVATTSRTYFFDVKESVKGSKYLVITEAKKVGDKFEHSRLFVFEDGLEPFTGGFKKALAVFEGASGH